MTPTPAPPNEARADPYRDPPPRTRVALRDGHWLINEHPTNPGSVAEGLLKKPPSSAVPAWFPQAPPLPPPDGEVLQVLQVATVDQLLSAVDRVGPGGTILLADGHYRLPRTIVLEGKRDIALRGASGDPARVTLSGQGYEMESSGTTSSPADPIAGSNSGTPTGSRSCTTRSGGQSRTGAAASGWEPAPPTLSWSTTSSTARFASKAGRPK